METSTPCSEDDSVANIIPRERNSDNFDPRPISFYVPVNDPIENGYKKMKRTMKSRIRQKSEENEGEPHFKLNHDEKMLQADILYQDQLNGRGELSRKHQEKYEKAKTKREMVIEDLRKKTEDKILRAEDKRKRKLERQIEKLKTAEERLAKVRFRKETMDQNFRDKTVSKLIEDEERLRSIQLNDLPLRAIYQREEILRYRQKLYEDRQQCRERTMNKNQYL
ncbi:uncharacterized protein LOC125668805 [Ostrea edulis]|uniref:uncharacterized protein LOC125668805 n=1 Tax=Ostrea edulis TaxID=37623 RepID=UPI0024AF5C4D|nr:uncharacterized protein LOC125668805 [Ostrea edulis]